MILSSSLRILGILVIVILVLASSNHEANELSDLPSNTQEICIVPRDGEEVCAVIAESAMIYDKDAKKVTLYLPQ